jgi:hypothetical protein
MMFTKTQANTFFNTRASRYHASFDLSDDSVEVFQQNLWEPSSITHVSETS